LEHYASSAERVLPTPFAKIDIILETTKKKAGFLRESSFIRLVNRERIPKSKVTFGVGT
jgi:hypothetical protein